MSGANKKMSLGAKIKDSLRRKIVGIKRNPSMIPLVMLLITFVYYSMNLTDMSNTTALIQGKGMGLCQFAIMLLTLLSTVCMLNAYPRRKKANVPMIVLMMVMFAVVIFAAIHYQGGIMNAMTRPESPIIPTETTAYIAEAYNMLGTYIILVAVTAVLVLTLPLYTKLLRKINTTVELEDNGSMEKIEIAD